MVMAIALDYMPPVLHLLLAKSVLGFLEASAHGSGRISIG